jgi:UDP-glucose 4-epimerase
MKTVLITGGAGYIGSHTALQLLEQDYQVVVVDNLLNSSKEAVLRVEKLSGRTIKFYQINVCNTNELKKVFQENKIDEVIHFAGLKAVGESVEKPEAYYKNNILSTLSLIKVMREFEVQKLVFSSSATVYNEEGKTQYNEETTRVTRSSNPYGTTKVVQEWMLEDLSKGTEFQKPLQIVALRYFNPVGAHKSGDIGEDPQGIPNNLTPFILQVAVGRREKLSVFGDDYSTPDGTCIRDYIHVVDLARAHTLALKHLEDKTKEENYYNAINIGSGNGYSVLEVVNAFKEAVGNKIPYQIVERRAGDLPITVAETKKAEEVLGFKPEFNINKMAEDGWRWQKQNPQGYKK